MARIARNPNEQVQKPRSSVFWKIGAVLMLVAAFRVFDCSFAASSDNHLTLQGLQEFTEKKALSASLNLPQDETCQQLPQIRSDGVFFLNPKVKGADSPPEVNLSYRIGTMFDPATVSRHMTADLAHYALLAQHFSPQPNMGVALDVGANQGFFTYFLATYGFTVHAFEINPSNFDCLQHGRHYNPKAIADRVHLYPMGMSDTVHRMSAAGQNYDGFLKASQEGAIQVVTADCFVQHALVEQLSSLTFLKIDVEGFEIAVLKGARNTLFSPALNHVFPPNQALLMEVGPSRWERANVKLEDGMQEMKHVASLYKEVYLLIRTRAHAKTCPVALAESAQMGTLKFEVQGGVRAHLVQPHQWDRLLQEMASTKADCNFWYVNRKSS